MRISELHEPRPTRKTFKAWLTAFIGAACLATSPGLFAQKNSDPHVLRLGVSKIAETFDPAFVRTVLSSLILKNTQRSLIRRNPTGRLESDLAYYWHVNRERTAFNFCMREQHFNNGDPITFNDIQYSLTRFMNSNNGNYLRKVLVDLSPSIEFDRFENNSGAFCFRILLKSSHPDFLYFIASRYMSIVPNGAKTSDTVGSGDFKVSRFDMKEGIQEISCVRFCDKYSIHKLILTTIPYSPDVTQLIPKNIDMYIGIDDYQNLPPKSDDYKIGFMESSATSHLFFNPRKLYFSNAEFRKDLTDLFQTIVRKNMTQDAGPLEFWPFYLPKGLLPPEYYKLHDSRAFDSVEFVKKWKDRSGTRSLKIIGTTNQLSSNMVQDLRNIFMTVGIELIYINDLYGKSIQSIDSGDYDLYFNGITGLFGKAEPFLFGLNLDSFKDSTFSPAIETFILSVKASRRSELSSERQQILLKSLLEIEKLELFIPLFVTRVPYFYSEYLQIPESKHRYGFDFYNIKKMR